ncbi:pentatricopeptide repeat-containing protein PNM1, mitochondrial-like [Chenopodium quinoa]|uniref:pentatricopeptide repeat-containing protein PNM1, mitochondrial-like n=1 Tax=Chenopodium quinoa TaxID=63459 RepID=UPI000B78E453|nr:pentatricopeptide repeat-containing protein PNM1, mitochondrial-like [Chenopodium quinoa]
MRIPPHLRRLLHLRHFSSSPFHSPPPSLTSLKPHFSSPSLTHHHNHHLPFLFPFYLRSFSSEPSQNNDEIALSLSSELLKPSQQPDSLSLSQRLDLSFSHITLSSQLILQIINNSPYAGRSAFDFFKWVSSKSDHFQLTDEVFSYFVDYFGRRKDFKIIHDVLVDGNGVVGTKTFAASIDRLVRAGRATQAVSFFDRMENEYGIPRDRLSLEYIVTKLCDHGYASYAEKMVKNLASEFFPNEYVCDVLIKGWCVDGKLEEARRLAREMYRGGFEIGTVAYNAILDCVCKLCREKDPSRIQSEADSILVDMDAAGVPRNTETFNVLMSNLCKIRKTEDAMMLFHRLGEWGCHPDAKMFLILTRSLYQAARVGEGDEMIDMMKSAGYGDALDKKAYYGFLKILCGIERIDPALNVFSKMKAEGCKPGVQTYDLLIEKLYAHNRAEKAKALFNEAVRNGVPVEPKVYKVDPRFEKKPKVVKKGKKRLTLPQKMALKRKNLRKLHLSYVKKPKNMMRRTY